MLFYKIGGASQAVKVDSTFLFATLGVLAAIFIISTMVINTQFITSFQAGSFSQSCYRFNTYIGVAVIMNSLGETAIAWFGALITLAIPMLNIFAVGTLIYHSPKMKDCGGKKWGYLFKALAANPLIIGCVLGFMYNHLFDGFPIYLDNTLHLLSMVTLPMALLSIGGAMSLGSVKKHLGRSMLAAFLKLMVLPVMGFVTYKFFGVEGVGFKVGMIFLCLPVSTAIFVLSSQLDSDTELASSAIAVSTLLSFFTLSIALLL